MSRPRVLVVLSALAVSTVLLVGCGSSDADARASKGTDAPSSPDASGEDAGDEKAPVDVPADGLSFAEARADENLTPDRSSELTTATGVLGFDHEGYVADDVIVVKTTDADAEDRQFSCIASGQLKLKVYTVVVVDEAGKALDC